MAQPNNDKIEQLYDLQILGVEEGLAKITNLNRSFAETKRNALDLKKALDFNINSGKSGSDIEGLKQKIADLNKELSNLQKTKNNEEKAVKAQQAALVGEAKIREANAKAIKAEEAAKKTKILTDAAEEKQIKKNQQAQVALAGSYNATIREYRELYNIVKATPKGESVSVNGSLVGYDQAIAKLKQLSATEQDFRRQFSKDGTLVGEYTSGILKAFNQSGLQDVISNQINNSKNKVKELDEQFSVLKNELSQIRITGQGSLEAIEKDLIANRKEALGLTSQIGALEAEMKGFGGIGTQITQGLSNEFKNLKQNIGQFIVGYFAFQQGFQALSTGIDTTKELSDQTTNLEIELGKAAGGAKRITDELAKFDTRTKLTVLEDIANIAAKAGVGEEKLAGVTQAIDKIKSSFGNDFGDVEKGTEDLVKLVNVFEGPENVSGESLLKVGNAVRTLANETVASVPYINDFSKRMAGLKGISDITLPAVLGLSSGFEQFGQSAEVSSTALVRIIPKLASDTEKYAKIAGLTDESFKSLLNTRPEEALLKVSEGLVKGKEDIESISEAFADSELGKGRIASVLGVLGKNADTFREAITSAGEAYKDTSTLEDAFAKKNNNLAATLDKIGKSFADAANNQTFVSAVKLGSSAILVLISHLPLLIGILGTLAAAWAINKSGLVLLRVEMLYYDLIIARNRIGIAALTLVQIAHNAVMKTSALLFNVAAKALELFNISVKASPLGITLTAITLLTTAFVAFGEKINNSTQKLKNQNETLRILNEIQSEAQLKLADTISKEKVYLSILSDKNISQDTQKKALKDLIALSPDYLSGLNAQNVSTKDGTDLIDKYNLSLQKSLELEAASVRSKEENERLIKLKTLQQQTEFAIKSGGGVKLGDVDSDLLDKLADQLDFSFLSSGVFAYGKAFNKNLDDKNQLQKLLSVINTEISKQAKTDAAAQDAFKQTFDADQKSKQDALKQNISVLKNNISGLKEDSAEYVKAKKQLDDAQSKLAQLTGTIQTGTGGTTDGTRTVEAIRADLKKVKKEIETATKEEKDALIKKRNELSDELKHALGKDTPDDRTAESEAKKSEKRLSDVKSKIDALKNELDGAIESSDDKVIAKVHNKYVKLLEEATGFSEQIKQLNSLEAEELAQLIDKQFAARSEKEYADSIKKSESYFNSQRTLTHHAFADGLTDQQTYSNELRKIDIDEANAKIVIAKDYAATSKKAAEQLEKDKTDAARKGATDRLLIAHQDAEDTLAAASTNVILSRPGSKSELEAKKTELQARFDLETQFMDQTSNMYTEKLAELNKEMSHLDTQYILGKIKDYAELVGSVAQALTQIQANNLQKNFNEQQDYDDKEKAKRLANAQSQEEKDAIEEQYDAKSVAREKEFARKKKAIAEKQLAIEFALASIRAITQGLDEGGLYGAIAAEAFVGIEYGAKLALLESQQFDRGGSLQKILSGGGVFSGPSHKNGGIKFLFGDAPKEVQGNEGYVINADSMASKQNVNVSGTPSQIASAANAIGGGINFSPGAKISKFEYGGQLGTQVRAPVFASYFNKSDSSNNEDLRDMIVSNSNALIALNSTVHNMKVFLNPNDVKNYNNQTQKAVKLGTL